MTTDEKRNLLVRLAEGVMGWTKYDDMPIESSGQRLTRWVWNPVDNIADAWLLVEALQKRFRRVEIHAVGGDTPAYVCMVMGGTSDVDESYVVVTEANTGPLAICLAADWALGRHGAAV